MGRYWLCESFLLLGYTACLVVELRSFCTMLSVVCGDCAVLLLPRAMGCRSCAAAEKAG